MNKFRYLKAALAMVLMVVGIKMLMANWLKMILGTNFNFYLLGLVLFILATCVAGSLIADRQEQAVLKRASTDSESD